jgi:hypothetical protein
VTATRVRLETTPIYVLVITASIFQMAGLVNYNCHAVLVVSADNWLSRSTQAIMSLPKFTSNTHSQ